MRTILRTLTTLTLATLVAMPAVADPVPDTPSRVTIVVTPLYTIVTWEAVEGEDVKYRVHGFLDGEWSQLNETRETYAVVEAGYDKYGVSAVVDGEYSDMASPCVNVNPSAAPDVAKMVVADTDCL